VINVDPAIQRDDEMGRLPSPPFPSLQRPREHELVVLPIDRNHILRPELAFQDELGDRVLDVLLDSALERAGAEHVGNGDRPRFLVRPLSPRFQ